MYSLDKKQEAINLRKEGYAFSYISERTGVAKSTLSLWLGDILFTLNKFSQCSIAKGQKHNSLRNRAVKILSLEQAEHYAEQY